MEGRRGCPPGPRRRAARARNPLPSSLTTLTSAPSPAASEAETRVRPIGSTGDRYRPPGRCQRRSRPSRPGAAAFRHPASYARATPTASTDPALACFLPSIGGAAVSGRLGNWNSHTKPLPGGGGGGGRVGPGRYCLPRHRMPFARVYKGLDDMAGNIWQALHPDQTSPRLRRVRQGADAEQPTPGTKPGRPAVLRLVRARRQRVRCR